MDFNVSADPPHVVEFRKEVAAWMAEQFAGHEHLRCLVVNARGSRRV
jgi:hypothetical protein